MRAFTSVRGKDLVLYLRPESVFAFAGFARQYNLLSADRKEGSIVYEDCITGKRYKRDYCSRLTVDVYYYAYG